MAAPVLPSFLTHFVQPAVVTGLGVLGNYYVLGGQITAFAEKFEGGIKEIRDDLKEIRDDVKEVRDDVEQIRDEMKDLETRQTRLEHGMTTTEKILKDRGRNN